jgi:hypothetical protein
MRIIFICLLFLGCTKEIIIEPKEKCWTCTEVWSGHSKGSKSWEVCDVLEAAKLDGRRIVKYTHLANNVDAVTVYLTTCKISD